MALAANDAYHKDIDEIKNSLRLLKSKQAQKTSNSLHEAAVIHRINRIVTMSLIGLNLHKNKQTLPRVITLKFRLFDIRQSKIQ